MSISIICNIWYSKFTSWANSSISGRVGGGKINSALGRKSRLEPFSMFKKIYCVSYLNITSSFHVVIVRFPLNLLEIVLLDVVIPFPGLILIVSAEESLKGKYLLVYYIPPQLSCAIKLD